MLGAGILAAFLAPNLYAGLLSQQAPPPGSVAATAPMEVIYHVFLREVAAFEKKADELERQGKSGDYWRTELQKVTELSDRQFGIVRGAAASCMRDVQAYNEQAAGIIKGVRDGVKAAGPGATVPPPPQELKDLEQKRKARILAAVEEIRTALGPGAFLHFDTLVRGHLSPGLSVSLPAKIPPAPRNAGTDQ